MPVEVCGCAAKSCPEDSSLSARMQRGVETMTALTNCNTSIDHTTPLAKSNVYVTPNAQFKNNIIQFASSVV